MNTENKPFETCAPDIKAASETLYQRLFDLTYGYLISSLSVFFFLVMLPHAYYGANNGISAAIPNTPGVIDPTSVIWSMSFYISAGFLAGGAALFSSMNAAGTILKYLFTLSGLIMLFKLKNLVYHYSSASLNSVLTGVIVILSVFALLYMMYRAHRRKDAGMMIFLNFYAVMFNFYIFIRYFISFSGTGVDLRVHYFSLVLIAAMIMQTHKTVKTYFPLFKWSLKSPGGIIPGGIIQQTEE